MREPALRSRSTGNVFKSAADNDFKSDTKRIRRKVEQGIVGALTRFHQRQIEKQRTTLKSQKRSLAPSDTKVDNGTAINKFQSKKTEHSANSEINVATKKICNRVSQEHPGQIQSVQRKAAKFT